jgi:hypothetical protein
VSGQSTLKVVNGTDFDAIVIIKSKERAIGKYVTRHNFIKFDHIAPCVCNVLFMTGIDWDGSSFTRDKRSMIFSEQFNFYETGTEEKTGYKVEWLDAEISLQPVIGGTARTTSIDDSVFEQAMSQLKEPNPR